MFAFYLAACMMLWVAFAPQVEKFILTDSCQKIVLALLAIGGGYLFAAVAVHWLSVLMFPPIRLAMDVDGKPRVRSLQEHELQLRPFSRQVSPASDSEDLAKASESIQATGNSEAPNC